MKRSRVLANCVQSEGFLNELLFEATEPWGVQVERVEVRNQIIAHMPSKLATLTQFGANEI